MRVATLSCSLASGRIFRLQGRKLLTVDFRLRASQKFVVAVRLPNFGAYAAVRQVRNQADPAPKVGRANWALRNIAQQISHRRTDFMLNPFVLIKSFLRLEYLIRAKLTT